MGWKLDAIKLASIEPRSARAFAETVRVMTSSRLTAWHCGQPVKSFPAAYESKVIQNLAQLPSCERLQGPVLTNRKLLPIRQGQGQPEGKQGTRLRFVSGIGNRTVKLESQVGSRAWRARPPGGFCPKWPFLIFNERVKSNCTRIFGEVPRSGRQVHRSIPVPW